MQTASGGLRADDQGLVGMAHVGAGQRIGQHLDVVDRRALLAAHDTVSTREARISTSWGMGSARRLGQRRGARDRGCAPGAARVGRDRGRRRRPGAAILPSSS